MWGLMMEFGYMGPRGMNFKLNEVGHSLVRDEQDGH